MRSNAGMANRPRDVDLRFAQVFAVRTLAWLAWRSSGMSDLCGTVAGMVTLKGSMSTEGETLQVSVLPYRYWYAPFCCVCLGCCAAEFGSSGGTYELPCILNIKSLQLLSETFLIPKRMEGDTIIYIHINDLLMTITSISDVILFADDTSVLVTDDNYREIKSCLILFQWNSFKLIS
jgi:hypothetical protein